MDAGVLIERYRRWQVTRVERADHGGWIELAVEGDILFVHVAICTGFREIARVTHLAGVSDAVCRYSRELQLFRIEHIFLRP